jgi:two-component sensor histidine kinase
MNPTGTGKMDESAQRFRSHIQIVISLLNLHAKYEESANIPDFIKKLRLRMELMAETARHCRFGTKGDGWRHVRGDRENRRPRL